MASVRMTPEQMKIFAEQFRKLSSELQTIAGLTQGTIAQLRDVWESEYTMQLADASQQLMPALQELSELLLEFARGGETAAEQMEVSEEKLANEISTMFKR